MICCFFTARNVGVSDMDILLRKIISEKNRKEISKHLFHVQMKPSSVKRLEGASYCEALNTTIDIEGTDYEALKDKEEVVTSSSKEDSSVTEKDDAQLLCKHKVYESPISVMDKWNSSMSTTTAHCSCN